ncbi:MAG: YdiU family protein [Myxococcota bacterium]|nr:YdiU family protein [Myxococcota bacterium]
MSVQFHNRYCLELPHDTQPDNYRRQVFQACYSLVDPTPVRAPTLVAYSKEVAALLGFTSEFCLSEEFSSIFAGNTQMEGMCTYASCYGGHQFGNWADQLGDGRAISLGELVYDNSSWELQLKGAGPTPYSRMGDGRAVLRSSIREFLCSEAMHHLGIPTTRALSLIQTGDAVVRDMFYDGNAKHEPGAIVCRVAPTFIRFGNFEIFYARRDAETQRKLLDFTLRHYYPECGAPSKEAYVEMFRSICHRTAKMISGWMGVGFVHGVMNTDNMSILGLTIDYGPYGWLDHYDPGWTPNTTDSYQKRYAYGSQPSIALWNLERLANALYEQIQDVSPLENALQYYVDSFEQTYRQLRSQKLGLSTFKESDLDLFSHLNKALQSEEIDMTIFYRSLAKVSKNTDPKRETADLLHPIRDAFYQYEGRSHEAMGNWVRQYLQRLQDEERSDAERTDAMNRVNPKYILRNYLAQKAIDLAEKGDFSLVQQTLAVMRNPFDEQPERESFAQKRPEWARNRPGCSTLSCSS